MNGSNYLVIASLVTTILLPTGALADVFSTKGVSNAEVESLLSRVEQLERRIEEPSRMGAPGVPGAPGRPGRNAEPTEAATPAPTLEDLGLTLKGTVNGYKLVEVNGSTKAFSPKDFKKFLKEYQAGSGFGPSSRMGGNPPPSLRLPPPPVPVGSVAPPAPGTPAVAASKPKPPPPNAAPPAVKPSNAK